MKKMKKILGSAVVSAFLVMIIAGGAFAGFKGCILEWSDANLGTGRYPDITFVDASIDTSTLTAADKTTYDTVTAEYHVKCLSTTDPDDGAKKIIYGKTQKDCTQVGQVVTNLDDCESDDLSTIVRTIINTVFVVIGMVAVVMIILGGISYATSQGDPGKVKKGKDTILYGIIGLVVSLLAFAIVNFVLNALQ